MMWFDIADVLLPAVYRAVKDMYAYARSLNDELLTSKTYMERIRDNFFIQICDTQTIAYWEALLGITPRADETIEMRRSDVLDHLNNSSPTTEPYVRRRIERLFPDNEYHLWFDEEDPYTLNIDFFTDDEEELSNFKKWFRQMCPAHLYYIIAKAVRAEFDQDAVYNFAHTTAVVCSLGQVQNT